MAPKEHLGLRRSLGHGRQAGRSAGLHIPLLRLCPHSPQPSATSVLCGHPEGVLLPPESTLLLCSHQVLQAPHPEVFWGSPTCAHCCRMQSPDAPQGPHSPPHSSAGQEPRGIIAPPPHTMSPLCCCIPSPPPRTHINAIRSRHSWRTWGPSWAGLSWWPPLWGEKEGRGVSREQPDLRRCSGSGYIAGNIGLERWDRASAPREHPPMPPSKGMNRETQQFGTLPPTSGTTTPSPLLAPGGIRPRLEAGAQQGEGSTCRVPPNRLGCSGISRSTAGLRCPIARWAVLARCRAACRTAVWCCCFTQKHHSGAAGGAPALPALLQL